MDVHMTGKHVLIADDSATVRNQLIGIVGGAGYGVDAAGTGLEVLKFLKSKKVDLLLLDIEMPQMNGFEVLRMIKNDVDTRNLRILCMTSIHTNLDNIHKLKELGATGYIQKDSSPEEILSRMERALENK
jgi:CheY-like chemotaxis protein